MKLKTLISGTLAGALLLACNPKKEVIYITDSKNKPEMGSSSGGGGFSDESSDYVLDRASRELAKEIKNSSPILWSNLPKEWTQAKFAELFENIRREPEVPRYRHNKELMFDYGVDDKGQPQIIAARRFFKSHSVINVNVLSDKDLDKYIEEAKLRLLHEAYHLLGVGKSKETDIYARAMAYTTKFRLEEDIVACQTTKDVDSQWFRRVDDEAAKLYLTDYPHRMSIPYHWIIHRPTGMGVYLDKLISESFTSVIDYYEYTDFIDIYNAHYNESLTENGESFAYVKQSLDRGHLEFNARTLGLADKEHAKSRIGYPSARNPLFDWDNVKSINNQLVFSLDEPIFDIVVTGYDETIGKDVYKVLSIEENIEITFDGVNIKSAKYVYNQRLSNQLPFESPMINLTDLETLQKLFKNEDAIQMSGELELDCASKAQPIGSVLNAKQIFENDYLPYCVLANNFSKRHPFCNRAVKEFIENNK
ncbi:MAG: hypothetical protein KDD58_16170 [Bdellovibrionales bacterium]|nr:hypothetical protein [Bdellovibrionales bacterium]